MLMSENILCIMSKPVPTLAELVSDNKVLFHAYANMEDGTVANIMNKFTIKFPPKNDPEYTAQVNKCLDMLKEVNDMGGNIDLSGPRSVIGDLVHLDPAPNTGHGASGGLTMRFNLSSPDGIKLGENAKTAGRIDLGNGVKASYQVTR